MASTFQEFHGISLAPNSFVENLVIEQLAADPVPVGPGRVWYNTTLKVFRQSTLDAGGAVVVRTFATAEELAAEVLALDGRLDTIEGSYIKKEGTVAFTAAQSMGGFNLTNVAEPVADSDAATKGYVDTKVAGLGSVFEYVGTVAGGVDSASALDLSTLTQKETGDYYKVTTGGYFKVDAAGTPFYVNVGDGLIFNAAGGVDVIDNTNSQVQGTALETVVTGNADTGFTVGLATEFKTRVSTLETEAAAAQTAAGLNSDGTLTAFSGTTYLDASTSLRDAAVALDAAVKSEADRAKLAEGNVAGLTTTATDLAGAINEHDAEIGSLSSLTTTDKTSLVAAINEIDALVGNGVADLKTAINDARFTYTSTTAATSHTVTHSLASTLVDVCVWIDRGDGVWRNDMAGVSIVDANSIQVDLTAARNIRITVEKMEDFV